MIAPTTGASGADGKNRAQARDSAIKSGFRLEPHVCRACFARVASFPAADGDARVYQCTNCGLEAEGHKASAVCACGIKMRKVKGNGRTAVVMVDAGIRCHENKARSPEFPSLYTASYAGAQSGAV